jgi:hypothetical protein
MSGYGFNMGNKSKASLLGKPYNEIGEFSMRFVAAVLMAYIMIPAAQARTVLKTEVVEEQDKAETKIFCSKVNERDAVIQCEKWLEKQTKSLGERLLTSNCSQGDMSSDTGCLYKAVGDVKYMMKKYRTETERD